MVKKRKSGEGTIYHRKDGRWEGRVVIGYDEKGLPKTKNVLAKTKTECTEKLKALKETVDPPSVKKADIGMTFGEWLDYWYQNEAKPRHRANTRSYNETLIYKHIIPELGSIPLRELTRNDLQQFYARLKTGGRLRYTETSGKGLSDRTVRACHVCCRTALGKAVKDGLIPVNPAEGCKLPPRKGSEMQVLTREELRRLLLQAKEDGCYEFFLLELSTGLRRGEILALQWDDLNFNTGELRICRQVIRNEGKLRITEPKTKGSMRTVVLPQPVAEVLKAYREQNNSRWIFPSPVITDAPLDSAYCRKKLHSVLTHAGIRQVRFHDIRHTFCAEALSQGMDVKMLSEIIGHTMVATTLDTYVYITDTMRQDAADNIDRGIGKHEPKKEPRNQPEPEPFVPGKGKRRKQGTGCVTQINENLWEGRYSPHWPDGTKRPRNVYAHSLEECEEKLAAMIVEMKAEIAEARAAQ